MTPILDPETGEPYRAADECQIETPSAWTPIAESPEESDQYIVAIRKLTQSGKIDKQQNPIFRLAFFHSARYKHPWTGPGFIRNKNYTITHWTPIPEFDL